MIFNQTNGSGGGGGNMVTLTLFNQGFNNDVYVPSNATWTGFNVDYETGAVSGTLTIPENSMFVALELMNITPTSSVVTFTKIPITGNQITGYAFVCYVGTSSGTVVL